MSSGLLGSDHNLRLCERDGPAGKRRARGSRRGWKGWEMARFKKALILRQKRASRGNWVLCLQTHSFSAGITCVFSAMLYCIQEESGVSLWWPLGTGVFGKSWTVLRHLKSASRKSKLVRPNSESTDLGAEQTQLWVWLWFLFFKPVIMCKSFGFSYSPCAQLWNEAKTTSLRYCWSRIIEIKPTKVLAQGSTVTL